MPKKTLIKKTIGSIKKKAKKVKKHINKHRGSYGLAVGGATGARAVQTWPSKKERKKVAKQAMKFHKKRMK